MSWSYRVWETVKTGSKNVGCAFAAVIALAACCVVAPAATSAEVSEPASLIRLPSTPTVTCCPWVVSGAPPAPVIAARAGHVVLSASRSPARSDGAIVAGVQATSQCPERWTRCRVGRRVTVPRPLSVSRSVTGSWAVEPVVFIVPAVKLAWATCRSVNAAELTDTKSAGGLSASWRIPAQSCLLQAAR